MADYTRAERLLRDFKGDAYIHGIDVLGKMGPAASRLGKRACLVRTVFPGADREITAIKATLSDAGVACAMEVDGPAPNAPLEDLYRVAEAFRAVKPDVVVSFGGGSTIDVTKAAAVLYALGGDIEPYFGTNLVTQAIAAAGKTLTPHIAIQTAASSAAHLTKYSNITNLATSQKKLIVDNAIVPVQPVFDYSTTLSSPPSLTIDGAVDGISHSLEVYYGAIGKAYYAQTQAVAVETISLVVRYLPRVLAAPDDVEARVALGLATDLGGYAIMIGGTNGGHLTSFSLVDVLSHGRACAMMNPYYTVFFAPAIQEPLQVVGRIFQEAGYTDARLERLQGRALGMAVAEAMIAFADRIGMPTRLSAVPGLGRNHIARALDAAKNPQLKMKLENMPVAMTADMVDEYMGAVLEAAYQGDLNLVKTLD